MSATQPSRPMPPSGIGRREEEPLKPQSVRGRLITLTLLAIAVLTVLLAVPGLRQVLDEIRHLQAPWLILAISLELASCASFVVIFRHFFDRLPARVTRAVAWTEMGSGALLPGGGAGSLALGGWLLHRAGMPTRDILRRSSGLFFLTSATNVAALIGGGLLLLTDISSSSRPLLLGGPPVLLGLLGAGGVVTLPPLLRHHPTWARRWPWLAELIAGISEAEQALLRPSWRQLGAVGYLGFDIAVLWATLAAVGYHPQLATLMLGYILGYLGDTIPIPGGIGVLEGGLTATLVIYGAPPTQTIAAVLVYHAIAFWIPSIGGLWAYARVRSQIRAGSAATRYPLVTLPRSRTADELRPRRSSRTAPLRVGPRPAVSLAPRRLSASEAEGTRTTSSGAAQRNRLADFVEARRPGRRVRSTITGDSPQRGRAR